MSKSLTKLQWCRNFWETHLAFGLTRIESKPPDPTRASIEPILIASNSSAPTALRPSQVALALLIQHAPQLSTYRATAPTCKPTRPFHGPCALEALAVLRPSICPPLRGSEADLTVLRNTHNGAREAPGVSLDLRSASSGVQ